MNNTNNSNNSDSNHGSGESDENLLGQSSFPSSFR